MHLPQFNSPNHSLSVEVENLRDMNNEILQLKVNYLVVYADEVVDELFV